MEKSVKVKIKTITEAVSLIEDGNHVALGGVTTSANPCALIREVVRQQKKDLVVSNLGITYVELLVGNMKKLIAPVLGGEKYGGARACAAAIEAGELEIEDYSIYAMALRYRAGAMGVSFLPIYSLLGSDILSRSKAKVITCPFTGEKLCAVPALQPDVALIHAQRADKYGNVQLEGPAWDLELAKAAKRVIVSVEEIVPPEVIRQEPLKNTLPFIYVTAVVEAPYGAHPTECLGYYGADAEHLESFLQATRKRETFEAYREKYVFRLPDHQAYLNACGLFPTMGRGGK